MAVRDEPAKAATADERAGPSSCLMAPTSVRCLVIRFATSRRSAARWSEEGHPTRRFALVRSVAEQPRALLRAALWDQGWRGGDVVDHDQRRRPRAAGAWCARPRAGRWSPSSTGSISPCACTVSSRSWHGLRAIEPPPSTPLDQARIDVERLRHLLWNGHHDKACEALGRIASWAKDASVLNDPAMGAGARRLVARCTELLQPTSTTMQGRADRLRPAPSGPQADLDLAGRGHRQPAGECPHEQATADALVASRRPSCALGQGRGAGRAVWPPGSPARGVVPQVFDTPVVPQCSHSQASASGVSGPSRSTAAGTGTSACRSNGTRR